MPQPHPLEDLLISKQIAPTPVRLLVLQTLQEQPVALSLTAVEQLLSPVDRVTVHRTLKTFADKGLIHRVEDGSGAAKYALCEPACGPEQHHDLHVHFFCTRCRQTSCLPRVQIPPVALPAAFRGQETSLVVKGLCPRCADLA